MSTYEYAQAHQSGSLTPRRRNFRGEDVALKTVAYVLLIAIGITTIFPFYWMVATSFKEEQKVFRIPTQWVPDPFVLDGYEYIFTRLPFGTFFLNSVKVSVLSTIGTILASSLAAYAFARVRFKGGGVLFIIVLGTMMIPYHVRMIPSFIIMHRLGLIDTHASLWLPAFFGSSYSVFLMRQYLMTLPEELMDAAKIDGCSHFGIYARIVLPLSKPILATVALLTFMGSWNNLLGPLLYLNTEHMHTLTLALTRFRGHNYTYWTYMMAGATITVLPIAIVFILTQKYFVQSVTLTGIKG
ncbi:MAG: carbohydrate ABC transporter permease [Chloroflexi bacterium]|nr:carbohydrate ABC transporter permease [Chloroflexota bacterium]